MIVDCHAHLVPPACLDEMRKAAPGALGAPDRAGRQPRLRVRRQQADAARRQGPDRHPGAAAWMDKNGIDRQVCGGWVGIVRLRDSSRGRRDLEPYHQRTLLAAPRPSRASCRWLRVPMQDGALRRADAEAGDGRRLPRRDDLDPAQGHRQRARCSRPRSVLEGGRRTGAVIHIHPSFDAGDSRVHDYGLRQRHRPGQRRHGGRVAAADERPCHPIPQCQDLRADRRLGAAVRHRPPASKRIRSRPAPPIPAEALPLLYTDTVVHDPRVLRFVVEMMGAERLMMGSDMPFPIGDMEPTEDRRWGRIELRPDREHQWRIRGKAVPDRIKTPRITTPQRTVPEGRKR